MSTKVLIIEIMGKHSNIILLDEKGIILDSAKHISFDKSAVRQILPGLQYMLPPSKGKLDPTKLEIDSFIRTAGEKKTLKAQGFLYQSYSGISPIMASEICARASIDADVPVNMISTLELERLYLEFHKIMNKAKTHDYSCEVIQDAYNKLVDFTCVDMSLFNGYNKRPFDSVSAMLEFFYAEKDNIYRLGQKTADLKKIVQQNIERCAKKKDVHIKTLRNIKNRETLKIWGELITANIYAIEKGTKSFTTQNFYSEDNSEITIPLDANLSPAENAQRYFKKYSKEKRTFIALKEQMQQNEEEINYLEGVLNSIQSCSDETDVEEIREELSEQGFIHKKRAKKTKKAKKSKTLHFKSTDGFDIYVGKNNKQNDELTMKFAEATDIWLHTKEIPGSHVIIRSNRQELPSSTLREGAMIAAYYSKAKNSSQVPVDYTMKRNVKKPNGAKPGFVIYDNYNTAFVTPDEELVKRLETCYNL